MSSRIVVVLTSEELLALNKIAEAEVRCPRDQIKVILRNEFESLGLITKRTSPKDDGRDKALR